MAALVAAASPVPSCAAVPPPSKAIAAQCPLKFVPIGVFERADDEGPVLVTCMRVRRPPMAHG